jgi:hypothetical protein
MYGNCVNCGLETSLITSRVYLCYDCLVVYHKVRNAMTRAFEKKVPSRRSATGKKKVIGIIGR